MSKQKKFFNELFTNKESPYGDKPLKLISDFAGNFPKQLPILDLGGGDGRNAVYLAQQGFSVHLVDFSEAALASAKKQAVALKVDHLIEFVEADLYEFDLSASQLGGLVCTYALHFLSNERVPEILLQAQERTASGGLHLVEGFLPGGTITRALDKSDITRIYSDWETLRFETRQVKLLQKGSNGEVLFNESFSLAAKKKLIDSFTNQN